MLERFKENMLLQESLYSSKACKSSQAILLKDDTKEDEIRPTFFKDIDKILHSAAYTRYIDKTQVYSFEENDNITRRVLHVQLVSKVARTLARALRLNEDLVESIALGHDVGHAPFGHFGESCLDEICQRENIGYFTHNEQSVRVLKDLDEENITIQTLDGILAHNGEILLNRYDVQKDKTKEQFLEEVKKVETIKGYSKNIKPMTLEGAVVRLSDIIAYIGRDIEDAIELNVIRREDLPKSITDVLGNNNSYIIDTIVKDILENSFDKDYLCFSEKIFEAVMKLKEWNYKNIYFSDEARKNEYPIRVAYYKLYDIYMSKIYKIDLSNTCAFEITKDMSYSDKVFYTFIKKKSKEYLESTDPRRIVIDYISGQTDGFFKREVKANLGDFIKWNE